jgi:hypothetical protein
MIFVAMIVKYFVKHNGREFRSTRARLCEAEKQKLQQQRFLFQMPSL